MVGGVPTPKSTEMAAAAEEEESKELPLVLLIRPLMPSLYDSLSRKFRFLKPWEEPSMPTHLFFASHAQSVRALLVRGGGCTVNSATLDCLPNLGLVITTSVGVNHIDVPECRRRGISVANAGASFSEDVADYAVGLLLDVLRRISASDRYVRRGLWPLHGEYRPLGSKIGTKTVGVVGLGSIGSEIAKRLEAFGCSIAYNSRNVLSALGKDGVIINIGRGQLIDEKELVRCLAQGEIGGAGLDVFENEPAVPKELLSMDNVVLSPHRAVFTPESSSTLEELITGNLEAFFSNKPLLTKVEE